MYMKNLKYFYLKLTCINFDICGWLACLKSAYVMLIYASCGCWIDLCRRSTSFVFWSRDGGRGSRGWTLWGGWPQEIWCFSTAPLACARKEIFVWTFNCHSNSQQWEITIFLLLCFSAIKWIIILFLNKPPKVTPLYIFLITAISKVSIIPIIMNSSNYKW